MRESTYPSRQALDYIEANLPVVCDDRTAASLPEIRRETLEMCRHGCERMLHDYTVELESLQINGIEVQKISPTGASVVNDKALLYHFGGGFVQGSPYEDIPIIVPLACNLNIPVFATHYRLAPEHPYPTALHDGIAVYSELLNTYGADNIAVAGESAGGNLTLAVLNQSQREGHELPRAVALMSPWVDLTNSGPSVTENDGRDPSLRAQYVVDAAKLYAPRSDLKDPTVSPLFAEYGPHFPPTIVTTGTRDLLMSGSIDFADNLKAAGVETSLRVWNELWHVFEWYPQIPEAEESLREIAAFVSGHLFSK